MKVLKICGGTWENASRDKRELTVCRELGHEVVVLAKGNNTDRGRVDNVDGFYVHRYSTRPLGLKCPNSINRILSLFVWAKYAKTLKPDLISGHDLPGLTIGWLASFSKKKGHRPKLVYDSHEFELGRNANRGKVAKWLVLHWERFLMKRCVFSIMVNDSIADEVQRIHRLSERPVVVRNIPSYWQLSQEKILEKRKEICNQLKCENDTFLMMYHGLVGNNRGIEMLLKVVKKLDDVRLVVLGMSSESYLDELKRQTADLGIADRVLFLPAVSHSELYKYIGASDVGMLTIPATCMSYYYALPNKLFENIQSLTPVITSNYPEMQRIVDKYGIGLCVDPYNVEEIVSAIQKIKSDSAFYQECKKNLCFAKEELCWENERIVLESVYNEVLR